MSRSCERSRAGWWIALLSAPLLAQDPAGEITRADAALTAGNREEAILILVDAERAARGVESAAVRETLLTAIRELAQKADPLLAERRKTMADVATILLDVSDRYAKHGWLRTAMQFFEQAEQFDAETAAARLPAIRSAGGLPEPAAQPVVDNTLLRQWFDGGRQPYGAAGWMLDAAGATSPTITGASALLMSAQAMPAAGEVGVELLFGAKVADGGLAFGIKNPSSFLIAGIHRGTQDTWLIVRRWASTAWEQLHAERLPQPPGPARPFHKLAVRFDRAIVQVQADDGAWRSIQVPVLDCSGHLGFYVHQPDHPPAKGNMFRNLRVVARAPSK